MASSTNRDSQRRERLELLKSERARVESDLCVLDVGSADYCIHTTAISSLDLEIMKLSSKIHAKAALQKAAGATGTKTATPKPPRCEKARNTTAPGAQDVDNGTKGNWYGPNKGPNEKPDSEFILVSREDLAADNAGIITYGDADWEILEIEL